MTDILRFVIFLTCYPPRGDAEEPVHLEQALRAPYDRLRLRYHQ